MSATLQRKQVPPSWRRRFGAWVFWASMTAANETSVWAPEQTRSPSWMSRAKTMAIISFGLKSCVMDASAGSGAPCRTEPPDAAGSVGKEIGERRLVQLQEPLDPEQFQVVLMRLGPEDVLLQVGPPGALVPLAVGIAGPH